ncbi:polymorphic toxin type 43 domain-containing protein [Sorangium sp. So ce1128]
MMACAGRPRGTCSRPRAASGWNAVTSALARLTDVSAIATAAEPLTDFIFDSKSGRFVMSTDRLPHGHDSILQEAGISPHPSVVGGRISRQDGGLVTDEWSGHYGMNWTPEIRQQFVDFMSKHGIKIKHTPWEH